MRVNSKYQDTNYKQIQIFKIKSSKLVFKVFAFLIGILFWQFITISAVSAHAIGQPPYFKINGVFTDYYNVPAASLGDFKLPNDIAKGTFLVNEPINFEIDSNALPVPAEVVTKTKFLWEYGDGGKGQGLKNTYTYTKPGTYFLDVYADSEDSLGPQLLQSTAIHILPNKDYKLPKAVIEVNGKQAKDPLLDIIDVDFRRDQKFSGSKSEAGSSQITKYFWDLGNMQSAEGSEIIYQYKENPYTVFPVLRLATADGFVVDGFVQLKDENAFSEDKGSLGSEGGSRLDWKIVAGVALLSLILAGVLVFIVSKLLFKRK